MRALDFFVNEYIKIAKLKHRKHRLSLSLSSATATCADALPLSRASSRFAIQRLLFYLVSVSDFSLGLLLHLFPLSEKFRSAET